jgi:hypothetical protein
MIKNNNGKINREYVSEVDQFLAELENSLSSKSESKTIEHEKFKKIFEMRDKPKIKKPQDLTWKDF